MPQILEFSTTLGASDLERASDEVIAELLRDGDIASRFLAHGLTADRVGLLSPADFGALRTAGQGVGVTLMVVIAAAGASFGKETGKVASDILRDIWKELILPRLRLRFGALTAVTHDNAGSTRPEL